MLKIVVVEPGQTAVVREVEHGVDSLKEIVGDFKSERFGHYHLLRNPSPGASGPFVITKIETDGDGEAGAFSSLTNEDVRNIRRQLEETSG
ncbi:hypothetical protein ACI7RC_17365 [Brevibacillus sp. B_LB10_24]|uniref:hypothetical protein n=1 Tax=Brevibacillus sp. B_LB10_24 TaxID=3380645 RepID=UPI0038BA2168